MTTDVEKAVERLRKYANHQTIIGEYGFTEQTWDIRTVIVELERLRTELDDVRGPQFNKRLELVASNWQKKLTAVEAERDALRTSLRASRDTLITLYNSLGVTLGETMEQRK